MLNFLVPLLGAKLANNVANVATDKFSKTAGVATLFYAVNFGITKLASHIGLFVGVSQDTLSMVLWAIMVVLFLVLPADYITSRVRLIKALTGQD